MTAYNDIVDHVVKGIEAVGAGIMTVGGVVVLVRYAWSALRQSDAEREYTRLRTDLGRVILVGLEILIVADIVRTIIVEPSLESVGVLGLIVVIRTVLSFSLEVEIDGAWPWRRSAAP